MPFSLRVKKVSLLGIKACRGTAPEVQTLGLDGCGADRGLPPGDGFGCDFSIKMLGKRW